MTVKDIKQIASHLQSMGSCLDRFMDDECIVEGEIVTLLEDAIEALRMGSDTISDLLDKLEVL